MSVDKITERSLYHPICKMLEENDMKNVTEISTGGGYLDVKANLGSRNYIIEVKIGDARKTSRNLLDGIAQAYKYVKSSKSEGSIVIEFPATARTPLEISPEIVERIAYTSKVNAMVTCDFWSEGLQDITPPEIFKKFKEKSDAYDQRKEQYVSVDYVVETIRDSIRTLAGILRSYEGTIDDLINTVVGRFDLFSALSDRSEHENRLAAIDLSAYILVNQLLFYHIYATLVKGAKDNKVDVIEEDKIKSIKDVEVYLGKIKHINYKAIYSVDILSKLPDNYKTIETIKTIICAMKGVRAANIKHDLMGRLFHESLPQDTRKQLATFYTKPTAAKLLTGLCIERANESVTDLACGSGTLLVSAYQRKEYLYRQESKRNILSTDQLTEMHNSFVQEDIVGLDIMPFAAHLTAVNLCSQNPMINTDRLQVTAGDSLELQGAVRIDTFKKDGVNVKPLAAAFQTEFRTENPSGQAYFTQEDLVAKSKKHKGSVNSQGAGEGFRIYQSDVIIMNPPFSDREKMPADYRNKLKEYNRLIEKCGNQINLWGFFLALADDMIKDGGKIGAIIPINIARGKATEKIREYILKNYYIKYIVKTTKDMAFSEAAAFRDVIVVLVKRKPNIQDLTGIIRLKQSLGDAQFEGGIDNLIKEINKSGTNDVSTKAYDITWVGYSKLLEYEDNLMPLLGSNESREILNQFIESNKKNAGKKLIKIEKGQFIEGFHASPKGLSQLVFVTRPDNEGESNNRTKRAFLVLKRELGKYIEVVVEKAGDRVFKIEKASTIPALRTVTSVDTIDITDKCDYFISCKTENSNEIRKLSDWRGGEINWRQYKNEADRKKSYLSIPERFNPHSPNTSLIAFVSDNEFITPHTLKALKGVGKEDAKIHSLYFNSTVFLGQILSNKEETSGDYLHLMEADLITNDILDLEKLSRTDKNKLMVLYNKIKDIKFPSLLDQFKRNFKVRVELDRAILNIIGLSDKEINIWLPKVYGAMVDELTPLNEVLAGNKSEEKKTELPTPKKETSAHHKEASYQKTFIQHQKTLKDARTTT